MQRHIHLARIPEGEEREYVLGLIRYINHTNDKASVFGLLINIVIAAVIWFATYKGTLLIINGERDSIIPLILLFVIAVGWTWLDIYILIKLIKMNRAKKYEIVRAWDVKIGRVHKANRSSLFYAKVLFTDRILSLNQYKLEFYSLKAYEDGLLIEVKPTNSDKVITKLIPQMDKKSKAYKLSSKIK